MKLHLIPGFQQPRRDGVNDDTTRTVPGNSDFENSKRSDVEPTAGTGLPCMDPRNMVYYSSFVHSESMHKVHIVFSLHHSHSYIF